MNFSLLKQNGEAGRTALRYLGVKPEGYDELLPLAQAGFEELVQCALSGKVWNTFPLRIEGDVLLIGDGSVSCRSPQLAKLFEGCSECLVMAVTLGPMVDRRTRLLGCGEMSRAMMLDACASVAADRLCDEVEEEFLASVEQKQFLTVRFSPGYGDLPMSFTEDLLALVNAPVRIGLTLTEKGMMVPVKSATAIAGISDTPRPRHRSCGTCGAAKCPYREEGGNCHALQP